MILLIFHSYYEHTNYYSTTLLPSVEEIASNDHTDHWGVPMLIGMVTIAVVVAFTTVVVIGIVIARDIDN